MIEPVGIDREAAKQAYSELVVGTTATASRIEFIDPKVQYLTADGLLQAARPHESLFIDIYQYSSEEIFDAALVDQIIRELSDIRLRAVA